MPFGGMLTLGAATAAAPIVGGVIGMIASSDDKKKAAAAMQAAMDQINAVQLPPDQAKAVIIQNLKSAGVWKPEMEQHIDAGVSQVSQIKEDPALRAKQTATLNSLQQIADTGMTATGRAQFNEARAKAQQDMEAKRQQILQQMKARGMDGSGAELAMQLQAEQGGSNEEAAAADRIASEQEQAKMAALGQLGGLTGQVRGQDFSINQAKAGAADAFKMFDVNNEMQQQARNVASTNQARQYDVMTNQAISNANTEAANRELYRQKQGEELNFQNAAQLASMKANAALGQAKQYSDQANNTAKSWQQIGTGVAQAFPAIAGAVGKMKTTAPPPSADSGTPVDLTDESQFASGGKSGALNGPSLPNGNYSTEEDPYWQQSMMASR